MKPKVFVTHPIPATVFDILKQRCNVTSGMTEEKISKDEIKERIRGKDGILCLLIDRIDKDILDIADSLKIISNIAVGYDNIDVNEATNRKIAVTNTPGVLTETTADFTWALILSTARRIIEADEFTREGNFKGWGLMSFLGNDIYGKTLGIIGMGRIGKAVAKRAKGFEMKVIYYQRNRIDKDEEAELSVEYVNFERLIMESDFISLHIPLTDETFHIISEKEFKNMKQTAIIINTSRGPVIDESALLNALINKKIAGAGLDVFEDEPSITPGLIKMKNVVLTPHIASASVETRTKMALMAVKNLIAGLEGRIPPNIVNPEVYR